MTDLLTKKIPSSKQKFQSEIKEPPLYSVILLNDHYTPMDFVTEVLESVFRKSAAESVQIMLSVHHNGSGVAGIYTKEIAETKVMLVHQLAKQREFPLRCIMEVV